MLAAADGVLFSFSMPIGLLGSSVVDGGAGPNGTEVGRSGVAHIIPPAAGVDNPTTEIVAEAEGASAESPNTKEALTLKTKTKDWLIDFIDDESVSCEESPCINGGSCLNKSDTTYACICPEPYIGKRCQTGPNDCYEGNGETYRGPVSITENGQMCLDWNSYIVLQHGESPFTTYTNFTELENNYCRNPDGEKKPWCFFKNKKNRLTWGYCKVKKCPEDPDPLGASVPEPEPTLTPPFSQCGKSRPSRTGRIFAGWKAFPGVHPWQASVQKESFFGGFSHICGGILISSCWVVTAAHCIEFGESYQVVLGGVNVEEEEEMDQTIPVIEVFVHEVRVFEGVIYNDIALLRLNVTDSPHCAKETPFVKPACLPDRKFPTKKLCVISGWGATEKEDYSEHLLNAHVFLLSKKRCKSPEVYGELLDDSMFCAGAWQGSIDTCQGDSGGPLICEEDDTHYLTGVVSWGHGCGFEGKPGVYVNVHKFIDWIKSKVQENLI
ncbi:hyaluronan-binding protein 2 [Pholidichthys leucotaenia]